MNYARNKQLIFTNLRDFFTIFANKTKPEIIMAALGRDRELTDREKYIVTAAIVLGKDRTAEDWERIFLLSRDGSTRTQRSNGSSQASSWKSRKPVKAFHAQQTEFLGYLKRDNENEAVKSFLLNKSKEDIADLWDNLHGLKDDGTGTEAGDGHDGDGKDFDLGDIVQRAGEVDFRDREQFLNFLNAEANRLSDQRARLDVLKMLSDLQRMKEAENGKNGEIQRFYTPLQCSDCELYRRERAKIESD